MTEARGLDTRAVDDVIKRAILAARQVASSAELVAALEQRRAAKYALSGKRDAWQRRFGSASPLCPHLESESGVMSALGRRPGFS